MEIKEKRDISGVYFRFKNEETGRWENRVFEDLPEAEQDRVMEGRTDEWLRELAKIMAKSLRKVCDLADITAVQPGEEDMNDFVAFDKDGNRQPS